MIALCILHSAHLPNSPGNSCCASKINRSVHQRSCDDDEFDPGGELVPDDVGGSRMLLLLPFPPQIFKLLLLLMLLLLLLLFKVQSEFGGLCCDVA